MTRTLNITTAEWAAVTDGTLWLVREQECSLHAADIVHTKDHCDMPMPAEFVQACAPCETCGGQRIAMSGGPAYFSGGKLRHCAGGQTVMEIHCPDCRVELVGPCLMCNGSGTYWNNTGVVGYPMEPLGCPDCEAHGSVTLGYGYAIGQPLLVLDHHQADGDYPAIVMFPWGISYMPRIGYEVSLTEALAHYGDPELLVGKWALQVQVVGS